MPLLPRSRTSPGLPLMFDGSVFLDMLFDGDGQSHLRASLTRFTPGARTVWHAHARGQVLYVTEGRGLLQERGGPVVELKAGDTAFTPAGHWHWHGAADDHMMVHLALWEGLDADGSTPDTEWGESALPGSGT